MRDDETWCKDCFDNFLSTRYPSVHRVWEDGTEPPDFFLTLDSVRFAVEISKLSEQVHTPKGSIPEASYDAATERFRKDVEQEALSSGFLSGSYALSFDGPLSDVRRGYRNAKAVALQYIERTRAATSARERDLVPMEPGLITIEKLTPSGDLITGVWNGATKWGDQIEEDAVRHLDSMLDEKRRKMARIQPPIILLADNRLALTFAVADAFRRFSISRANAAFFDGVFVLSGDGVSPVSRIYVARQLSRVLR